MRSHRLRMWQRVRWFILCTLLAVLQRKDPHIAKGRRLNSFAGPYRAFVRTHENCKSDQTYLLYIRYSHFNPFKPSEPQRVTGNVTIRQEFNVSFRTRVVLDKFAQNEWKRNAFVFNFPGGACSAMRDHAPGYFNLVLPSYPHLADRKMPCRASPKTILVHNKSVAQVYPHFPVLPYGRYRMEITGGMHRMDQLCFSIDCEVIPKVED